MPQPSAPPTDPAPKAQPPWRRPLEDLLARMPAWLRRSSVTIRMAVFLVLLVMFIAGWGTFSIWVNYHGAVYLALVTIAIPLWVAYMFWRVSRR